MKTEKKQKAKVVKQKFSWQLMWKQRYLLLMSVPFVIWLIIFKYVPLWGWTMAFQEVKPNSFALPVWQRKFVGVDNFKKAFTDRLFGQTMINTIGLSVLGIALGTVMAILFALMLNEICFNRFKKVTQTISYLPHFVSWVILANIITNILGANGIFNTVRSAFGATDTVLPMTIPGIFRQLLIGTDVWKEFGYNAVIYLAALTGISPSLYEAAAIDGASRWKRVWHITIPGLVPTIVLLTTLAMGNVLNAGFDQVFNMYNQLVIETGDIIDTYVYRVGITNMQFSLATAAGLFKSVVSFVLVVTSYVCAYKFADYKIF